MELIGVVFQSFVGKQGSSFFIHYFKSMKEYPQVANKKDNLLDRLR